MKQYKNLEALLSGEPKASALFSQIPQYAREQIISKKGHVKSMDELEAYVHNVLRGDG
ncbi:hypothetical protein [Vermiculatibacterium agrestimuris]|uniref:hypothetical protein n=1 Tax=Vermiculatibacterium agrestimuris TaxID=2941519 RepID=UPI00203D7C88|nr:hypothetical protein [Vermiculatibacterium agrestimuris]